MKTILAFNGRADSQNIRVEREPKEKDTRKLIVAAAERLFRQIGFQKTTVIDIAHELHMSPTRDKVTFARPRRIDPTWALLFRHDRIGVDRMRRRRREVVEVLYDDSVHSHETFSRPGRSRTCFVPR